MALGRYPNNYYATSVRPGRWAFEGDYRPNPQSLQYMNSPYSNLSHNHLNHMISNPAYDPCYYDSYPPNHFSHHSCRHPAERLASMSYRPSPTFPPGLPRSWVTGGNHFGRSPYCFNLPYKNPPLTVRGDGRCGRRGFGPFGRRRDVLRNVPAMLLGNNRHEIYGPGWNGGDGYEDAWYDDPDWDSEIEDELAYEPMHTRRRRAFGFGTMQRY